jgi:hypothetical protein
MVHHQPDPMGSTTMCLSLNRGFIVDGFQGAEDRKLSIFDFKNWILEPNLPHQAFTMALSTIMQDDQNRQLGHVVVLFHHHFEMHQEQA